MAESASTSSGTTSTGSSSTGAGSQSTSTTSTSNSGPTASGSQSSSNGSFSTGNGNNGGSNSGVGPGLSFSAGVKSNSNGNFSGGLPGLTPGFTGFASSNFGQGWGNGSGGSSTNSNKSEPAMTVDEVYGKTETGVIGNQSIVESQGDYEASSNEKSNVETSTFGKQDEISVTPLSITEDKGLVNNDAIQSVEGLNFQQKDKANQEVMEAKKSRDEAEAEDKSNQMREALKAKTDQTAEEDAANQLQIGEKNTFEEESNAKLTELNNLKNGLSEVNKSLEESESAKLEADKKAEQAEQNYQEALSRKDKADAVTKDFTYQLEQLSDNLIVGLSPNNIGRYKAIKGVVTKLAEGWGIEIGDISKASITKLKGIGKEVVDEINAKCEQYLKTAENELGIAQKQQKDLEAKQNILVSKAKELESKYAKAQEDYKTWEAEYWTNDAKAKAEEEASAVTPESTDNAASDTKQAFDNAIQNAVENGADEQTVQAMTDIATSIVDTQTTMKQAIAANDIPTYFKAQKNLNKNLKKALGIGNRLTQTDYNKSFVAAVAKANDFEVTLADGTKTTYSQFATKMVTKSPEIAEAMYEAKAQKYEEENHPILAKIERTKAAMVGTWLGSKLTLADNQVRSQFNQMAKTNMRATYASQNNVLNDPNATPEQKAEAFDAILQANALMTASAALKASTGFFPGIGDSMKDGVYGVTNVDDVVVDGVVTEKGLNAYQKTLNAVDNLAKVILGLGVTPGANKAYQNMYYLAGAKVSESGLFTKDYDGDGFALCQEYGNNAAVGMIAGVGQLATGVALFFNPLMWGMAINLVVDSVITFTNGLYGVQKDALKSKKYTQEVLNYFEEAQSIVAETGNKEALDTISSGIAQIENFELKADEVGNLDNWLEGSGSNTATNEKFNQSLTYDEWLKLIEADPTMRDYAKKLIAEKKEK